MREETPGTGASRTLLSRIRRSLLRTLGVASDEQLRSIDSWIRAAETHLAALQGAYEQDRTATCDALENNVRWVENAEAHFAAVEESLRQFRVSLQTMPPVDQLQAMDEWRRGVEAHLSGLQNESERIRGLTQRHVDQLARVIARAAFLETRIDDVENADTDIAATIAGLQSSKTTE